MSIPPERIPTARLLLRRPIGKDAAAIYKEYAADPEVTRYLAWRPHASLDTVSEYLNVVLDRWSAGEAFCWTIVLRATARPIGMLEARIREHKVEIGYVLGRGHWGHGYMPEAIAAFAEWALSQPDIFRLWAVCDTENTASARVLEKTGFEREGILRRWLLLPNRASEPRDCWVYSRVK